MGFDNQELYEQIKSDTNFRKSLVGSLIRLLGLRNELMSYNIDQKIFLLIDTFLAPLYKNQNGSYSFSDDKLSELIDFLDKLIQLVDTEEIRLINERENLFERISDDSSKNLNSKQILLDYLQQKIEVLSEVKKTIANCPSHLNKQELIIKLNAESEFNQNLTHRISKLLNYRIDQEMLFFFDQKLIEFIDVDLKALYLLDIEMNTFQIKENVTEEFVLSMEKIKSLISNLENELLKKQRDIL